MGAPEPSTSMPHRCFLAGGLAAGLDDLPLFAATLAAAPAEKPDKLRDALASIDPDALAPREALDALYTLKRLMADEG